MPIPARNKPRPVGATGHEVAAGRLGQARRATTHLFPPGRMILSSDGPLFDRNIIKSGRIRALYVPQQLTKLQRLKFVLAELDLPLCQPRCMACGGELTEVPKHEVMDEAPPLAYRNCEKFWRCGRCGKLLWHGTHWQKITRRLDEVAREAGTPGRPPDRTQ